MTERIKFWDAKTREVSEIDMPRVYTFYQAVTLSSNDKSRKFGEFWPDDRDNWQINDVFAHGDCAWWTWDGEPGDGAHGDCPSTSWDDFFYRFVEVTGTEEDGYQIVSDGECDVPPWPALEWAR